MKRFIKYMKQLLCRHSFEDVKHTKWYFHKKCTKCGFENGMGNFTYKN